MFHQRGSFLPPIVRGDAGQDYELEAAVEDGDGEARVVSELPEDLEEAEFKAMVDDFNKAEGRGRNSFQPRSPFSAWTRRYETADPKVNAWPWSRTRRRTTADARLLLQRVRIVLFHMILHLRASG